MEEKQKSAKARRKHITIRMPETTWHKLTVLAREQGLTINAVLINAINEKIANY